MCVAFEQGADRQAREIFRAVLADPPRFALQRALVKGGRQVCAWTTRRNLVRRVEQVVGLSQNAIERPALGAFAGGGGILRQARPDSRREILLVAAFYGRARKATAQFYPAMATHFEG